MFTESCEHHLRPAPRRLWVSKARPAHEEQLLSAATPEQPLATRGLYRRLARSGHLGHAESHSM